MNIKNLRPLLVILILFSFAFFLFCSEDDDSNTGMSQDSFDPKSVDFNEVRNFTFTESASAAGLPTDSSVKRVSAVDIDGDNNVDIILNGNRIFKGDGKGKFTEITDKMFPGDKPSIHGALWADYDNDGDMDCYTFIRADQQKADWTLNENYSLDYLWVNNGGVLTKATTDALPDIEKTTGKKAYPTCGAAWADYDNDGLLDLVVVTNWTTLYCCSKDDYDKSKRIEVGNTDFLFKNAGGGKFVDKTSLILSWWNGSYPIKNESDIPYLEMQLGEQKNPVRRAYGVNWVDFDNDGDQDIYVSNYRLQANQLFINNGGSFIESAISRSCAGIASSYEGATYYGHTVGSAWGDYNNDGYLDALLCNLSHPGYYQDFSDNSLLYENNEDGIFEEVHKDVGIYWRIGHANPCWGDINNDGLLDAFLGSMYYEGIGTNNGMIHYSDVYCNYIKDNKFEFRLMNHTTGIGDRNDWTGIYADVNNDGWLDLIAGGNGDTHPLALYINQGIENTKNTWIKLLLKGNGTSSNKNAIGARITINVANKMKIVREINAGFGSGNQYPFIQHIGLGKISKPVTINIRWPDGKTQEVKDLELNKLHEITQS